MALMVAHHEQRARHWDVFAAAVAVTEQDFADGPAGPLAEPVPEAGDGAFATGGFRGPSRLFVLLRFPRWPCLIGVGDASYRFEAPSPPTNFRIIASTSRFLRAGRRLRRGEAVGGDLDRVVGFHQRADGTRASRSSRSCWFESTSSNGLLRRGRPGRGTGGGPALLRRRSERFCTRREERRPCPGRGLR